MNNPIGPAPAELGVALAERGYESLWIGEHPQIPVSRKTPYPGGGQMPESYRSLMDPFLALLSAAQAAPSLRVGTGVALPITLVVSGDPEPSALARYRDLGVTRATIGASRKDEDDPDSTLRFLDRYAQAAYELA